MRKLMFFSSLAFAFVILHSAAKANDFKSAKECNDELRFRRGDLKKVGESLREFVDDCWWHSKPGTATILRGRPGQASAPRETSLSIPQRVAAARSDRPNAFDRSAFLAKRRRMLALQQASALVRARHARQAYLVRTRAGWMVRRMREERSAGKRLIERRFAEKRAHNIRLASYKQSRVAPRIWRKDLPLRQTRPDAPIAAIFNGRRAWVRSVSLSGKILAPAVVLVAGAPSARDQTLRCWNQPVMFWNQSDGARWSESAVCAAGQPMAGSPVSPFGSGRTTLAAYRN